MSEGSGAAEVGFRRDDAYLREQYLKWWLFRSGWRRWLWLASLLLAIIALLVIVMTDVPGVRFPAVVIAAAGLSQGVMPWLEFRRWKRTALGGLETMPDLRLSVDAGVLRFGAGPNVRYDADGAVVRVAGGRFLYERGNRGRHVYLPDRWWNDPRLQALLAHWRPASPADTPR